jgi:hypothetical protein
MKEIPDYPIVHANVDIAPQHDKVSPEAISSFRAAQTTSEDAYFVSFHESLRRGRGVGTTNESSSWHRFPISLPHPVRLEQSKVSQWSFEIVKHALKEAMFLFRNNR